MFRVLLTCVCFISVVGCSDPKDDPSTTTTTSTTDYTTYESFVKTLWPKICANVEGSVNCSSKSSTRIADRCATLPDNFTEEIALIKAGKISYNATKAKSCETAFLAQIKTQSTAVCWGENPTVVSGLDSPPDCEEILTGTVADSGACDIDDVCMKGSYCGADFSGETCEAKCMKYATVGQSCGQIQCAKPLQCSNGKCAAAPTENTVDLNGVCNFSDDCKTGLYCDYSSFPDAKCKATKADAAACTSDEQCSPTSSCINAVCAPKAATNAECDSSNDCKGRQLCVKETNESAKGLCKLPVDVGSDCKDSYYSGCFQDLICNSATKKCAQYPAAGADCVNNDCASSAYCDTAKTEAPRKCVARKADGAAATNRNECLHDFNGQKCVAYDRNPCNQRE